MDARYVDFLTTLEQAGSVDQAWADTREFFSALGHSVVHS